jgi:Family of unknown function (DUF6191)
VPTPLDNPARPSEQRVLVSFFELFQPGLKYLREEKDRQKILVAKPSHGGGAPLGIDLDAGTAKITIARSPTAPSV